MSGNELEPWSPGGLQPYTPSDQPLSPRADDWGVVDYSHDLQSPDSVTFFGNPVSASEAQLEQLCGELCGGFQLQMSAAGQAQKYISAATSWFSSQAFEPPRQEQVRHRYNLPAEYARDPVAVSFANHMAAMNAPVAFIMKSILWLEEIAAQLSSNSAVSADTPVPGTAFSSADPYAHLTDKQYAIVLKNNELAQAQTLDKFQRLHGQGWRADLALLQSYFEKLPVKEQRHLEQPTGDGYISGLNSIEVLQHLFFEATNGNQPVSAKAVADEIAQIEHVLFHERAKYNRSPEMQARLRYLYGLRG